MKPVGKPDAGNRHIRFDERGWETGRWPTGPKLPRLSSTLPLYACVLAGRDRKTQKHVWMAPLLQGFFRGMMFFGGCGHVYGVCGTFDRCPDAIHGPAPDHSCGHDARASGGFFRSCRALSITPLSPLRTL